MNTTDRPTVRCLAPGEGRAVRIGTHEVSHKASSAAGTGYSIAELRIQPGKGAALHSHPREETLYVLSGELDVLGETGVVARACAGAVVHVPGRALHGFVNAGETPARALSIGSLEQQSFFDDMAAATSGGAPDAEAVNAVSARHQVEYHDRAKARR
ncbi:MAG: cupin domain-containing protein [Polyangiaceae bacterium]